jgi:hypothetical protein
VVKSDLHSLATLVPRRKIPNCKLGTNILFYLIVAYIYSTHVLVGSTEKMSLLNILKFSFQFSAFSNISVADEYNFASVVASTTYY